jgi:hypothetical protein
MRKQWMPWKERSVMEERMCSVFRVLDGEAMGAISQKIWSVAQNRYKITLATGRTVPTR